SNCPLVEFYHLAKPENLQDYGFRSALLMNTSIPISVIHMEALRLVFELVECICSILRAIHRQCRNTRKHDVRNLTLVIREFDVLHIRFLVPDSRSPFVTTETQEDSDSFSHAYEGNYSNDGDIWASKKS